jgi:hypothetical protein
MPRPVDEDDRKDPIGGAAGKKPWTIMLVFVKTATAISKKQLLCIIVRESLESSVVVELREARGFAKRPKRERRLLSAILWFANRNNG